MNNFDISTLEKTISDIVKGGGVSTMVYNNRPKAAVKVDDFVVVNVSGNVVDRGCFGTATVAVDLFAKDVNNFKNSARLKYMYDRLVESMPRSSVFNGSNTFGDFSPADFSMSDFFMTDISILIDGNPTILGDTPDDYGFTARLINFKVIIKIA